MFCTLVQMCIQKFKQTIEDMILFWGERNEKLSYLLLTAIITMFLCSCGLISPKETIPQPTHIPNEGRRREWTPETTTKETVEVHSIEADITFDDILDVVVSFSGSDYYNPSDSIPDRDVENRVRYICDSSDIAVYYGMDNPYTREEVPEECYYVTGIFDYRFILGYKFSESCWADIHFQSIFSPTDSYPETSIVENHPENGFRLVYNNDGMVHALYLINDSILVLNVPIQDYRDYLDLCNQLGLPTCDEITEAVL